MCEKKFVKILILISIASVALCRPINSDYYRNNYEVEERKPNAYYNRLPPASIQVDEPQSDDYDDDDTQTDKPVYNSQYQSASYQSGSYPVLVENKIKRKKRKRLCIPIQSIGSPLFSNRVKRNYAEKDDSGRTLGLLLGGGGYPYYGGHVYPSYAGNYPYQGPQLFPQQSPVAQRPQQSPIAQFGAPLYDAYGGYPCVPVSTGHIPHSGPFGFFGSGGLFDTGSSSSNLPINYPQTVIINRPPLFGNRPNYGNRPIRPQGVSSDSDATGARPGFFGAVVDKLSEFVTAINPEGVYSTLGDALQSWGQQIAMAPSNVASVATEGVKNGYREFASLFY